MNLSCEDVGCGIQMQCFIFKNMGLLYGYRVNKPVPQPIPDGWFYNTNANWCWSAGPGKEFEHQGGRLSLTRRCDWARVGYPESPSEKHVEFIFSIYREWNRQLTAQPTYHFLTAHGMHTPSPPSAWQSGFDHSSVLSTRWASPNIGFGVICGQACYTKSIEYPTLIWLYYHLRGKFGPASDPDTVSAGIAPNF